MKKLNLILILAMLVLSTFQPGASALAKADSNPHPASAELTLNDDMLNPDGTLRLDENFVGSLDFGGWDVQLDPQHGPVFSASQSAPTAGNWESLGSGGFLSGSLNDYVNAIAISGTDVYVGGWFTDVNNGGTSLPEADYVAKWNGSNWSPLGTNGAGDGSLNGPVYAIAVRGSEIYVGGGFTDVNNYGTALADADYLAKYDANTAQWSALGNDGAGGGSLNGVVQALAVGGDNLYVGGAFSNVVNYGDSLFSADYIARFNFNSGQWYALGHNGAGDGPLSGWVFAIAVKDYPNGLTEVYAGGGFTDVNNSGTVIPEADYIARYYFSEFGSGWSPLGHDGAGDGSLKGGVFAIALVEPGTVYAGGNFTNVNNHGITLGAADFIAAFNTSTQEWSSLAADGTGDGVLNSIVRAITAIGDIVYVGGLFTDIDQGGAVLGNGDYIARWDGASNWSALGSDGSGNGSLPNGALAIAIDGDTLYTGGQFGYVNNNGVLIPQASYVAAYGANNPPIVESVARLDATPTANAYVDYLVTFSEPVYNATVGDFTVAVTAGSITGSAVSGVSGSDGSASRIVTVFTGSGNGSLRLDVEKSNFLTDSMGNFLGGWFSDGSFRNGEIYTIDKTAPTVSMSSAAPDPTNASPIAVTVAFSESVTGFTSSDIIAGNGTVSNFAGSDASYTFDLTPAGQGLVTADIAAGAASDSAGNGNTIAAQFSRMFTVVYNLFLPLILR